jgi:hypothetical protein
MTKKSILLLMLVTSSIIQAQTDSNVKVEARGFNSQVMFFFEKGSFTGPENNFYFNLGGPAVRVDDGIESIGLFVAPSMRMRKIEGVKPQFLPVIGFGVEYGYKRLVLSACQFYKAESGVWIPFQIKKKQRL